MGFPWRRPWPPQTPVGCHPTHLYSLVLVRHHWNHPGSCSSQESCPGWGWGGVRKLWSSFSENSFESQESIQLMFPISPLSCAGHTGREESCPIYLLTGAEGNTFLRIEIVSSAFPGLLQAKSLYWFKLCLNYSMEKERDLQMEPGQGVLWISSTSSSSFYSKQTLFIFVFVGQLLITDPVGAGQRHGLAPIKYIPIYLIVHQLFIIYSINISEYLLKVRYRWRRLCPQNADSGKCNWAAHSKSMTGQGSVVDLEERVCWT